MALFRFRITYACDPLHYSSELFTEHYLASFLDNAVGPVDFEWRSISIGGPCPDCCHTKKDPSVHVEDRSMIQSSGNSGSRSPSQPAVSSEDSGEACYSSGASRGYSTSSPSDVSPVNSDSKLTCLPQNCRDRPANARDSSPESKDVSENHCHSYESRSEVQCDIAVHLMPSASRRSSKIHARRRASSNKEGASRPGKPPKETEYGPSSGDGPFETRLSLRSERRLSLRCVVRRRASSL